jgi:peroxiredoxin
MKSYKLLYLLPLLVFSFCSSEKTKNNSENNSSANSVEEQGQVFTIKGKLENYNIPQIILQEITPNGTQPLDTATVDEQGNFTINGFIREKTYALINLGQYRNVFFVIDTTSNIDVSIDGGETLTYEISNSKASEEIAKMANTNSVFNQKVMKLNKEIEANPAMSAKERATVEAKINGVIAELKSKQETELKTLETPLAKVFSIEMLQVTADRETEQNLLQTIANEPNNKWYTYYRNNAQARIVTAIGSKAPDITLNTPQGTTLSLSSLQGKYVLIDFWASWCRPCRAENPNVVRVYNKYKDKGFEIFGVSLDQEADAWVQAIAQDGLTWKHVSDLGGWQSSAAKAYKVSSIPQTLLLDKEGVIIAKNLRGGELEAKLSEVFN